MKAISPDSDDFLLDSCNRLGVTKEIQLQALLKSMVEAGKIKHQQTILSRARQKINLKQAKVREGSIQSQKKETVQGQKTGKARQKHGNAQRCQLTAEQDFAM